MVFGITRSRPYAHLVSLCSPSGLPHRSLQNNVHAPPAATQIQPLPMHSQWLLEYAYSDVASFASDNSILFTG